MIRGGLSWLLFGAIALLLPACGEPDDNGSGGGDGANGGTKPVETAGEPFSFQWEFWSLRDDEVEVTVKEPVAPQSSLPAGSPIYMRLGLNGSCHVYVMSKDPGGKVEVLYPKDPAQPAETGVRTLLRKRSKLDAGPGRRRYYVFASHEPLEPLAALMADMQSADDSNRTARQSALLAEVQVLRKAHEDLKSATTKPAAIGGTVRGDKEAVEISAKGVYVRTYTIAIE